MTLEQLNAFLRLDDAIKQVRYELLGLPEIPEQVIIADYFDRGADLQVQLYKMAIKRREKP